MTVRDKQPSKPPLWTPHFIVLNLSFMSLSAGFQMLLPTLPLHASTFVSQTLVLGLLVNILSASATIVRPFVGLKLQTGWAGNINLIGLAVSLAATLGYFAESATALLAMRLLHGIGWGISTTAYGTMVAAMIPPSRRGEGMSGWGFGMALTMAFGPLLGNALFQAYGFGAVVAVSAALTLLALLLAPLIGKPQLPPAAPLAQQTAAAGTAWHRWIDPVTLKPASLHALLGISYGGIVSYVMLFGAQNGIGNASIFFLINSLASFAIRLVSGRLDDRFGRSRVLIPGAVLCAAGLTLLGLSAGTGGLITAALLYGTGFGVIQPSLQAWTVSLVPPSRWGAANSTYHSAFDGGILLGTVTLGWMAASTNYATMYMLSALAFVGYVPALLHKTKQRRPQPESGA